MHESNSVDDMTKKCFEVSNQVELNWKLVWAAFVQRTLIKNNSYLVSQTVKLMLPKYLKVGNQRRIQPTLLVASLNWVN